MILFEDGSPMYRLFGENMTINGYFSYVILILHIFNLMQHGCLIKTVSSLDPNHCVIKRLWCIFDTL